VYGWPALASATVQLSVIVPTHDRPLELRRCLESLREQVVDGSKLEIVVVDDGSESDIDRVVGQVNERAPIAMRCERQPLSGLNTARNRGAASAQGELLAFLDDDTIVAPGWARALLSAFADLSCEAVGGRVELGLECPEPEWLAARRYYLAEYDLGREARWIEADDPVPVGANCAVRASAFERLGGFRVGLDRIGRSLVSNGDTEFFYRLRSTGAKLRYEPQAGVIHVVPAARLTVAYFVRRHYAQGISDELQLGLSEPGSALRRRAILLRWLLRALPPAATALWRDLRNSRGTVMARFAVSYWAGRLVGAGMVVPDAALTTESAHPAGGAPAAQAPP
jgi:glucosyl-dolichyl phosphate glucuronosyltransferase